MQEVTNTITIGFDKKANPTRLQWRNSNGILIAGIPGSGKSQTASFYLTQYAYKGAKILLCDYNAGKGIPETLMERIPHLEPSFYENHPPVTTTANIINMIKYVKMIGDRRYSGEIPVNEHIPLILVIDEFPAFLLDYAPSETTITKISGDRRSEEGEQKTIERQNRFIEELISSILKFRKVNIKYMIIGQDFTQISTSGVRVLRDNITATVLHRMNDRQSALFGLTSVSQQRMVQSLRTGQIVYQGQQLRVPLLSDVNIAEYQRKYPGVIIQKQIPDTKQPYILTPQDKQFLQEMIAKYQPIIDKRYNDAYQKGVQAALQQIPMETTEDLIRLLLRMDKSPYWIEKQLRGASKTLRQQIQSVKDNLGTGITEPKTNETGEN